MGIKEIFGKWPGDETDEEIEEALYGDKRRAQAEREAIERVITEARAVDAECSRHRQLRLAIERLDAARSKETK